MSEELSTNGSESSISNADTSNGNKMHLSYDPAAVDLKQRTLNVAEINYIKLARPNGVYVCYLILLLAFVVVPLVQLVRGVDITYPNLPEPLYWLIEGFFGVYVFARSYEKAKGGIR